MAQIESFRSVHYNPVVVEDVSKVICPPYDIIDAAGQEDCYQRHSYNIIRLILGKEMSGDAGEDNKYSRAAGYMDEWLRRGVLVEDNAPSIYLYQQIFEIEGQEKSRIGFIALMRIDEEDANRTIHPHEHTHTAPKEDRFKLIQKVEANLSPIFMIFSDPESVVHKLFDQISKSTKPFLEALEPSGIKNLVWKISDRVLIDQIKQLMDTKDVLIADGHHRYEVAKMFRALKREQGKAKNSHNYLMAYFTPLEDQGLCIFPTHRLIKEVKVSLDALKAYFQIKELPTKEALSSEMESKKDSVGVFGVYLDGKFYLLKLSEKRACSRLLQDGPKEYKNLDVVILHKVIFDQLLKIDLTKITYEVSVVKGIEAVNRGSYSALFLLNPTKMEQIRSIALGGEVMPQKSTYFYPKLATGLVIRRF